MAAASPGRSIIVGRRVPKGRWEQVGRAIDGDAAVAMIDGLSKLRRYVEIELRDEDTGDTALYRWPRESTKTNARNSG